jgi:hypothetical protein
MLRMNNILWEGAGMARDSQTQASARARRGGSAHWRHMAALMIPAAIALTVFGCAGTSEWEKEGVSQAQREGDMNACMRKQRTYYYLGSSRFYYDAERVDPGCMEIRGYKLK